jgi:hypothetical protein
MQIYLETPMVYLSVHDELLTFSFNKERIRGWGYKAYDLTYKEAIVLIYTSTFKAQKYQFV